jgi:hypothetical protein
MRGCHKPPAGGRLTLQAASLIDEYNVWTFPVVLGRGKRFFGETAKPFELRLVRSQVSTTGVVLSTIVPGGDIRPGSCPALDRPLDRLLEWGLCFQLSLFGS